MFDSNFLWLSNIWHKVFKSGINQFCGRQPLKNLKEYGLSHLSVYRVGGRKNTSFTSAKIKPLNNCFIFVIWHGQCPIDYKTNLAFSYIILTIFLRHMLTSYALVTFDFGYKIHYFSKYQSVTCNDCWKENGIELGARWNNSCNSLSVKYLVFRESFILSPFNL